VRRAILPAAIAVLAVGFVAAGCSDDDKAETATANPTASEDVLKKDCADPHWKQQNLGLWYSVCRQPLRW